MDRLSPTGGTQDTNLLLHQNGLLQTIAAGASLLCTLTAVTDMLQSFISGSHSAVFVVDQTRLTLSHAAGTNIPRGLINDVQFVPTETETNSVWPAKTVIASDIAGNEMFKNIWPHALRHGYRAHWSLPVTDSTGTLQSIVCLFFTTPRYPRPGELQLLKYAGKMIRIAIQHDQMTADRTALHGQVETLLDQLYLALQAGQMTTWQWDLSTGLATIQAPLNQSFGQQPAPLPQYLTRIHPDDLPTVNAAIKEALQSSVLNAEFRCRKPPNKYSWYECRGKLEYDDAGKPNKMHGVMVNITRRKRKEHHLQRLAHRDALTGLHNRHFFRQRLETAVAQGVRANVMVIDLDNFSHLNDTLGDKIGDELLVAIGRRLIDSISRHGLVARLGGDEFGVLLIDAANEQSVNQMAHDVIDLMGETFIIQDHEINISVSIGISPWSQNATKAEDILRTAGYALFTVKKHGKSGYKMYSRELDDEREQRQQLIRGLGRSLRYDQLRVHYQPIFSLAPHRIVAVEALVRWQHPTKGLILPDLFISLAEETGLIQRLGNWVLEQAALQVRMWQTMFPHSHSQLVASVNVSLRQFARHDFCDGIHRVLNETGLPAHTLQLEITESVLMSDTQRTVKRMEYLRSLGTLLAVDDFGKGQSSLSYFKHIPLNTLKIDRHFTSGLNTSATDRVLVNTIVTMSRELGINVVAEGIENKEQLTRLKQFQCQLGQGHFLGRPMPAPQMENLLRTPPPCTAPCRPGTKAT